MEINFTERMNRGLAYGEACFETFRVIDGAIFDWAGHWQRLALGMAEFGIALSRDDEVRVREAALTRAAIVADDVLVRVSVSGGDAPWGLLQRAKPVAHVQTVPHVHSAEPLRLDLLTWPFPLREKQAKFVADYAETVRALKGRNDAAVLFEQSGQLLAAATANILLYRQGEWHTPALGPGILPGRIRAFLMSRAEVYASRIPLEWLDDCESMAICNSGVLVRPVTSLSRGEGEMYFDAAHPALQILSQALKGEPGIPTVMAI